MSYSLAVPLVWNNEAVRESLLSPTCDERWLFGIDSRVDPGPPSCPHWFGILRQFDVPWSGLAVRPDYLGSSYWASGGFANGSFATRTSRRPDMTASGGQTDISPMSYLDYDMTGDAGASWPYSDMFLRGLDTVRGNPFTGVETTVLIPWYRHATGMTDVILRSARKTGTDASPTYATVNSTAAFSMAGAEGWQLTSLTCGTGAGDPGMRFHGGPSAVNETGTRAYLGHVVFHRGTPGNRLPGMFFSTSGIGGYNNLDAVRQWGGDGANRYCTIENAAWHLQNVCLRPNRFVFWGNGQNGAPNESAELSAGVQTTFLTNTTAIVDNVFAACDFGGMPRPQPIFINDYKTGYSDLHHQTRGRAMFALAQRYGGVFIDAFQAIRNTPIWMADGVHLTGEAVVNYPGGQKVGNGADHMAAVVWNLLTGRSATLPRLLRRR
jgi:hypothetical protein